MTRNSASRDRQTVPVAGDLRLPKPPGVIRQFWYRHPWLTDSLIAAAYAVPGALTSFLFQFLPEDASLPLAYVPVSIAVSVLGGAALMFRRHRPWLVVIAAWVLALAIAPFTTTVDPILIGFALYALAVYGSVRAVWIAFGLSAVVGAIATLLAHGVTVSGLSYDGLNASGSIVSYLGFLVIVVLIGINIGNRRRYVVALVDRAAQLARERDQQAQLSAAAERSRIAREMHDIVSHGLTVMVTLAEGAAATTATNPDRATEAMRQVAESGRNALADMRRMLGVLDSDGSAEFTPQPGIAELGGLIERFRGAGLDVRFSSSGTPPTDSGEQLTVYRLVQESLTNVLRHSSDAGAVAVRVRYTDNDTAIEVTNDGPVMRAAATQRDSPGHGIDGMRQRVALYGGTVESGPRPGGGWAVSATLKHEASRTTTIEEDTA